MLIGYLDNHDALVGELNAPQVVTVPVPVPVIIREDTISASNGSFNTVGSKLYDYEIYGTLSGVGSLTEPNINKLPLTNTTRTNNGITFSTSDYSRKGGIKITGYASSDAYWVVNSDVDDIASSVDFELPAGEYVNNLGLKDGQTWNGVKMELRLTDSNDNVTWISDRYFTLTETTKVSARIAIKEGYSCLDDEYDDDPEPLYPAIYLASVGKPYKFKIRNESKNKLQNTGTSQTINGVTFTVNEDGSVTCNGTSVFDEETSLFNATFVVNSDYVCSPMFKLSGCPEDGGSSAYCIEYDCSDNGGSVYYDEGSGEMLFGGRGKVSIIIYEDYECNNLTFYPMIADSDEDSDYAPYFNQEIVIGVEHPLTAKISATKEDIGIDIPTFRGNNTLSEVSMGSNYGGGSATGGTIRVRYEIE